MRETDGIKDLENQANNTRYLIDRLNKAAYGVTFSELIKSFGNRGEEVRNAPDKDDVQNDR